MRDKAVLILADQGRSNLVNTVHGVGHSMIVSAYRALAALNSNSQDATTRTAIIANSNAVADALPKLDCSCSMALTGRDAYLHFRREHFAAQSWLPEPIREAAGLLDCKTSVTAARF